MPFNNELFSIHSNAEHSATDTHNMIQLNNHAMTT